MNNWSITITGEQWAGLYSHLFPGDGDEHGAVLRCGVARTSGGTRLLVRDVVIARDGVDYIEGDRGYRKLTASFVQDNIDVCSDEGLAYLAVHCHGGRRSVGFSQTDMASHDRGYPALLDINAGPPVGALVFASEAVAGDIWTRDGQRHAIEHLRVVGRPQIELRPDLIAVAKADATYDRQSRIFGDRGQAKLSAMRVAVIGLGGAGSLICEYLARLGVGELLLIDPDRIDVTNLSRVVGATRLDALAPLRDPRNPAPVRWIGERFARSKVSIGARVARQANPRIITKTIRSSVLSPDVAMLLRDSDHIFLAADSALVRRLVNSITHQYLIPNTQVGAKVTSDVRGSVVDVFSVMRASSPGSGCLSCNGLIPASRLQEEATPAAELRRQKYVEDDGVHAPSVVTLNAVAASNAVNDWLMVTMGLTEPTDELDHWVA